MLTTSGPVSVPFNAHAAPFSGTPYTGAAISLPGRIEAENFDNGGEGVAYHDTTATNDGGSYRSEGVDVCTCGSPYGLSVGWTQPGEWMEYTVTVASYGTYKFQPLTATTVTGTALHIEVDGINVTGQVSLPNTGSWTSYATMSSQPVTLTAGQHIVRVAVDVSGFLIDSVDLIRLNTAYGGTATVLPGTIPAENFDNGGEGIAYHDTTAANEGGAYRSEGVDLCVCGNSDGAALGWSQVGEWTRYTVNVSTTDTYTLKARMSTIGTGSAIHLEFDGVNVTGQMVLPNTGAWDAWATISKPNVQISAGQHELKMVIEGAGFLLDSLSVIPSVPIAPSGLTASAVSTSQINLAWADNSFNESGFKIERKTGASGTYAEITTTAAGVTSFNDTGRQPGTQYFYRVRATNQGGDSAYSNEATAMTSNLLPSVSLTSPSGGTVFTPPANFTINASASDSDGTISKVEFFQGSTKLGEDVSAPYSFTWTSVSPGTYSLTAKATDNLGGFTTSSAVNIDVIAPSAISRLDPMNRTGGGGEDPLSRNFNWTLPLVNLPGRAGMDLSISLSYNSLVWTKTGSYISFDDDHGFPSPGFRLGFPVIQSYFNSQLNQNGYILLAPDGSRVELRQVPTATTLYQAVDSSYLLLDSISMTLSAADGTQFSYVLQNGDFQCTKITDRNGNYLSIGYTSFGRIDTVVDTLHRTVNFNYDGDHMLRSITQDWTVNGSSVTHTWASFEYTNPDLTINTNFTGLTTLGAQNGSSRRVLTRVTLADSSRFEFNYTSWGQVWKISEFANDGQTLLNYRSYDLPLDNSTAQTDCPRFTQRRDWAKYWNRNTSGIEQEAITSFIVPTSASWTMPEPNSTPQPGTLAQVSFPDGTYNKIYSHSSGWDKGLPLLTETYDNSQTRQRQVSTAWTQDDPGLSVPLNPRVIETNIYDPAGNRKRTRTTYQQISLPNGTACSLPQDVFEYQANATTVLRSTRTTYNTNSLYTDRRIIGLVSQQAVYDGDVTTSGVLASKFSYQYDETDSIQGSDAPVQHDNTAYGSNFVVGRANLSSVRRYDVNDTSQLTTTTTRSKYNTAGAVISTTDASNHTAQISYEDSFSDSVTRHTFAYPTTSTDPDGYTTTIQYNFDSGAVTEKRIPQPGESSNLPGPRQSFTYDSIGRLERTTSLVDNAYTRYIYGPNYVEVWSTVNNVADEAHTLEIFDGAGRAIATAKNHPPIVGGFSGQLSVYDAMGRAVKQSNPTETSINIPSSAAPINPYAWTAAGDDAAGWIYTQQTYDWKGRPLTTTNQDGTTKTASYAGCGCAGGEVVTLTDEGTLDGGVAKRRQRKIYSDVLGRLIKTEVLNWESGSVYSATITTYNVRDQVTQVRQYTGAEGSPAYQDTISSYDGYGRLQTRHVPEQNAGTATVWTYNADDTLNTITDARGAVSTFGYAGTSRHLVKQIAHTLTGNPTVSTSFTYDAVGNRLSMTDDSGSLSYDYNQLGKLRSETRTFTAFGSFTLTYDYNLAGELTKVIDPFGEQVVYGYDSAGRLNAIGGAVPYASDLRYRASGGLKSLTYGDSTTLAVGYDANLRISTYEIPGLMKKSYQYYADSRLSFTQDQLTANSKFDRLYKYDHLGRVTTALTGQEARGGAATNDRPYNENMAYDAMGHLNLREVRQWDRYNTTGNETYINNRRQFWQYDADGRLLSGNANYVYDAAGQISSFDDASESKTDQQLDGDGRRIRSEHKVYNPNTNQWATDEIKYYVHSSVLGQLVTELNAVDGTDRSFVYHGDKILAIIHLNGGSPQFTTWEHYDPADSSYRSTYIQGDGAGGAEMDPLGADAGLMKPLVWNAPTSPGKLEPYYGVPELNSASSGCVLDGLQVPCSVISEGNSRQCWNNQCRAFNPKLRDGQGGMVDFHASSDGREGYLPVGWLWTGNAVIAPGGITLSFPDGPPKTFALQEGEQLSECLRNALRQFFPNQSAQNHTYSPVDDARFKAGIPGWVKIAADPSAITLGLRDIHYDRSSINLSGGSSDSLQDIIEEVAHTVQFIQLWSKQKRNQLLYIKYGIDTTSYESAQNRWDEHYAYYAAKGRLENGDSYKNDVEKWAKNRTADIMFALVGDPEISKRGNLCGFDLTNYSIKRPDY